MAWEILRRVEEEGAYADALLGNAPSAPTLAARDRALLTRLVYSTLAWQGYLDHVLAAFCTRPPAALDAPVRTLLRLTLCQICVFTKIPPFAAVNTAVELAKRFRGGAAAGLVNAVLRRAATSWHDVQFPSLQDDPIGYLSTRLSHPRWLVERWVAQYGLDEAEALLRANNEPAPTALRVNRLKGDPAKLLEDWRRAGRAAEASPYSPVGIRVADGGPAEAMPGYTTGMFSAQGEASQLVSFLLGAQAGERILDVCAAPGGKATHLAELMDNRGELVAIDVSARGIERLAGMARRLGLSILHPVVTDATAWHPPDSKFDRVLLDAPCSGLGTLRQHPEIRWRRTPEDIASLAALQWQLLLRAAEWVRPGGVLVYATCTLSPEENDEVIGHFLQERPLFLVDDPRPFLPAPARELVGRGDAFRTLPHQHDLDGFFAVRLKARG
jgi:16S rRNA (cytosine967-C5)-methyltransferase